jgi:pyruvate/2-oxoglutarate dehydrogenase complex dihydrolipoamide acyltransferase (E2) component
MRSSPTDRGNGAGAATSGAGAEVVMPQMGVSVAEGTIVSWLKQPGDAVAADEPICEVTTDKVDVEIPSPAAGTIAELLVEEGATVKVGTVIARLTATAGERREGPEPAAAAPASAAEEEEIDRSSVYSPVVRRIAARHGVDLDEVEGHGIGGRVRKADLLEHIRATGSDGAGGGERPLHSDSPYRGEGRGGPERAGEGGAVAEPASGDAAAPGLSRRVEMDPMRKAIARHMVMSRRTSAHCTTVVEADFSAVERVRAELREPMRRRGVPLTPLAFVAHAVVAALQRHPILNASIEEDQIVLHEDVDLGIAVALDEGLVVPVIRRAQRLSLEGLAGEIAELSTRARAGELSPDQVGAGTFTITNPGRFGALIATPIINQPQVAILDLEAIVRRPVVVGSEGGEAVAVRPMAYLCMSWDHRALDGVAAARFLGSVRERLEGAAS